MEPLLRWFQEDKRTYKMKTSNEEIGPLAYADDLSVVTEDPQDAVIQPGKIETYCNWAGVGINVDPIRRNKTVYTSVKRRGGNLAEHIGPMREAQPTRPTHNPGTQHTTHDRTRVI